MNKNPQRELPHQSDSPSIAEEETRESNQSLWLLAAGPLIWAIHFLATYMTVAL